MALRALIYIRQPQQTFDPRSFAILKQINSERPEAERISLAQFKEMMKEQFLIVMQDQERAVGAIPMLLPTARGERSAVMGVIRQLVNSAENASGGKQAASRPHRSAVWRPQGQVVAVKCRLRRY